MRTTAVVAAICGLAYICAGLFFLLDPSSGEAPGSPAFWAVLAQGPAVRAMFLFCFGLAGLLAFSASGDVLRLVDSAGGVARLATSLGQLGYAVTAVTYFRLLAGEGQRAQAMTAGPDAARTAILSFSLSLDTQGWLMFAAVGLSLALTGLCGMARRSLPLWLCAAGLAAGVAYEFAFAGLYFKIPALVTFAAAAGGIGIGPLWWGGIAVALWRREARW